MTHKSRITAQAGRRTRLAAEGIGSLSINQTMKLARHRVAKGSVAGDWDAVAKDLNGAVRSVRRELETA